jgi:hypothetical protein
MNDRRIRHVVLQPVDDLAAVVRDLHLPLVVALAFTLVLRPQIASRPIHSDCGVEVLEFDTCVGC